MRPRIVFWAGQTLEDVAPPVLNERGIGGSETALIEIARRFQADGWRTDVYVRCGRYEGEHDGVGYWEPQRLGTDERCDVLVSWRQPAAWSLPVQAHRRVAWLHDHNQGEPVRADLLRFDRVLGVSDYHRGFLADAYGLTNVSYVPNGIDLTRFDPTVKKIPGRCVYASSPDRGLVALLKMWPEIRGNETKPELHVAYGWENFDRWIDAGRNDMAEFKAETMALLEKTPGVVYRGRLPQDALARLYGESYALLYPGDFLETSCITAMEAMAGGCIPITSSCGATKETVGDGGLVVWGPGKTRSNPYSPSWRDFFVNCARSVLYEVNTRKFLELKARERAKCFSWDAAFERWREIVTNLLEGGSSSRDHWKPLVEALLTGGRPEVERVVDRRFSGGTQGREMVAAG